MSSVLQCGHSSDLLLDIGNGEICTGCSTVGWAPAPGERPGSVSELSIRLALTLLHNQAKLIASGYVEIDAVTEWLKNEREAAARGFNPERADWCEGMQRLVEAANQMKAAFACVRELRPMERGEVGVGSDG